MEKKAEKINEAVTALINRADGFTDQEQLLRIIYNNLQNIAQNLLQHERPNHTLNPSDLINESYVKLFLNQNFQVNNRFHFFSISANAMRQILTDHARAKNRLKRSGMQLTLSWADKAKQDEPLAIDILEIENALVQLEAIDARQAKIVMLKFYAGLTTEDIASFLEISESTVKREWAIAKLFLKSELKD